MSKHIGKRAIVVGAGIAGLCAAVVLAEYFDHVLVLETDALPERPTPRPGTPQSKHGHGLLVGGQESLSALLPGFERDLEQAGAIPLRISAIRFETVTDVPLPQRDFGYVVLSMSRPLIEWVLRSRTIAHGNIAIRDRTRVDELVVSDRANTVKGVWCTTLGREEQIPADLVVDASGHGLLTLNLLKSLTYPPPEETSIGIDVGYTTAIFEKPADATDEWKAVLTLADPPRNRRAGLLLPAEGNSWIVTLAGAHGEKPPVDEAGFHRHARALRTSTISEAVKTAERKNEFLPYAFPASRRRRFDRILPEGLLPFGDAICRFNPIYGQGMTVAAQEAGLLRRLLAENCRKGNGTGDLAPCFFEEVESILDVPWTWAAVPDFADPLTKGDRPEDLQETLRFIQAVFTAAVRDPVVHRVFIEVRHMLKPQSALRTPEMEERIHAAAGSSR
jgi:2-polyprenyl-6-methoxyphenol hydroxylase-like FAD-dependent oxidoreductase